MKNSISYLLFSLLLMLVYSCESKKTNSILASEELNLRMDMLSKGSHFDETLLNDDVLTSEILRDPSSLTFEEVNSNYILKVNQNVGHIGLENYKRFFLRALIDHYDLELIDDVELKEFYLKEHFTLINFKSPQSEIKLLKSIKGEVDASTFESYSNTIRSRILDSIEMFNHLLRKEEISNSKEKSDKINLGIIIYNDLLKKLDSLSH